MARGVALALVVVAGVVISAPRQADCEQPSLLELPLVEGLVSSGAVPKDVVPLTDALSFMGNWVRGGYVLFGVEVRLEGGKQPAVKLQVEPGARLGSILHALLLQLPRYQFEVVSEHLIDIYPVGAKGDPKDALNLRVPAFDVAGVKAGAILNSPERFIPELKIRLTPKPEPGKQILELYVGGYQAGPPVTLHFRNVTVRDILNGVSKAMEETSLGSRPLGWVYSFERAPDPQIPLVHSWKSLYSLPYDWRSRMEKAGQNPPK